jgi:hypothetical protein
VLGELAAEVCGGDADAYRFLMSLSPIALTWDHAVDGDTMDRDVTMKAFLALVLDWPVNPFVRTYAGPLTASMSAAISAWMASDSVPGTRVKAYDVVSEIFSVVAFILGGWERVNRVMPRVRATLAKQVTANDLKGDT